MTETELRQWAQDVAETLAEADAWEGTSRGIQALAQLQKLANRELGPGGGRCLIGGSFSDETGWWMVDEVFDDGSIWLVGENGENRVTTRDRLPPLEYLEEHCTHPGGCYKPPFPF
jgi:hypothetical protein